MNPLLLDLDSTIAKVTAKLGELKIPFAYTGGLAVIAYGDPRTTQDVDLILRIDPWDKGAAAVLAENFGDDFYFSVEGCLEAIEEQSMFQAIDRENMLKVGFHLSNLVPDSLERIRSVRLASGQVVPMVSPEDSILSKLVWIKMGSGRSKRDVVAILRIQTELDTDYLDRAADELGVAEILADMRAIAERNDPNEIY